MMKKIFLLLLLTLSLISKPRLSIITFFGPDDSINDYLRELSNQSTFYDLQIYLSTTDASEDHIAIINQYQLIFDNIFFHTFDKSISRSQMLNYLIDQAHTEYITFLHVDNHRSGDLFRAQVHELEINKNIDVVYTDYWICYNKNTPREHADPWYLVTLPEFSSHLMYQNIPGPHALWRKSLHEKYGYFDITYKHSFFWEFWNRCAAQGCLFKKIVGNDATYFFNYYNQKKLLATTEYVSSYQEDAQIRNSYSSYWHEEKPAQKPFVIITTSYQNKDWYKRNLDSTLFQEYDNYRIIYIDDHSPDQTGAFVQKYVHEKQQEHKITLIINEQQKGALANLYAAIHSCKKEEIIVIVDGDDWLAHNQVLTYLNQIYQDTNIWLTYGQFQWFPANIKGFSHQLPNWIFEQNAIRDYQWTTTHLRTFYAGLYQLIDKKDLLYEDNFARMAWDLAIMFPMIEMASTHVRFIDDILYIYNTANVINDNKVNIVLQESINKHFRAARRYKPVTNIF